MKNEGWKANDNSFIEEIVGNGTLDLKVEPMGCWDIFESATDTSVNFFIISLF